ncbi:type II secretion system protein GspL (plasmid) [Marinovum sp. KMM 9989]
MKSPRIIPISDLPGTSRLRGSVVLSVPGEQVSALLCEIPPNLRGKAARNVALQAVQDMLASPAEATALSVLPGTGSQRTVLVAAAQSIAAWHGLKTRHKLRSARVLPDYLCLPWQAGTLTLCAASADRLVVRTGETTGFSGPRDTVLKMLELTRTRQPIAVKSISLVADQGRGDTGLMAELSAWGVPIGAATYAANPPDASLLAGVGHAAGLGPGARSGVALVMAGLAAVGIWAINTELELREYQQTIAAQRAANARIVRDEIGLSGPIVDLEIQVDRALDALRQSARDEVPQMRFPDLLRRAGPVIAAPDITVTELRYGAFFLDIALEVADFASLEAARSALHDAGVASDIQRSVGSGAGGVTAVLRVTQDMAVQR